MSINKGVIMKNLTAILKLLLFLSVFIPTIIYADSADNDTCAESDIVTLAGTTGALSDADRTDYYTYTATEDGSLSIDVSKTSGLDFRLFAGTACQNNNNNWDLYSSGNADEHILNFPVTTGQDYFFRFRINKDKDATYNFALTFTPEPPPNICTGTPGLNGNYYNNSDLYIAYSYVKSGQYH